MQHSYCTDIPWGEAQPGDLVFIRMIPTSASLEAQTQTAIC